MNHGFGQFCPIALASEVLTQRWMLLIIHQLMDSSTRFNDIRRGVPKISATLLKQRLEALEYAEIVEKSPIADTGNYEYFLTPAGKELKEILLGIGTWGQRWARDIEDQDLDPGWLVWNMHRRLDTNEMPAGRTVIHLEFTDANRRERFFWLVVNDDKVDVCLKYPGFSPDIKVTSTVRVMAEVWKGCRSIGDELAKGSIELEGHSSLRKGFPSWLLLSPVAHVKSMRQSTQSHQP